MTVQLNTYFGSLFIKQNINNNLEMLRNPRTSEIEDLEKIVVGGMQG